MADQTGMERLKLLLYVHFERVLVVVLVASLLGIHYLVDYKIAFLSFYYLPIIIAGFFLGRNTAVLASVLITALVLFFQALEGLGVAAGLYPEVLFTLIPWAGFLILTGYVVGLLAEQRQARTNEVKDAYVALLELLTVHLEANERQNRGHSHRVARLAVDLGRELGLRDEDLENLRVAGLLHEIGPRDPRLLKLFGRVPGTAKQLPLASAMRGATDLLHQYERYYEVVGDDWPVDQLGLPLGVKILAVADAFETLQLPAPHRTPLPRWAAVEEIERGAGRTFAVDVVRVLKRVGGTPERSAAEAEAETPALRVERG